MEFEGSIGGLFMTKKHDFSDKKNSVCQAPLPLLHKFGSRLHTPPLKQKKQILAQQPFLVRAFPFGID
jgi:hypothetical protein